MFKPQGRLLPSILTIVLLATLASLSLHSVVAQVATGDFSLALSNTSISIPQGSSGMVNLYVGSLNGFAQTVSLSSSAPAGVAVSFNGNGPSQMATSPGATTSSTVTIYVDPSVASGSYWVTVTGASPTGITHSTIIQLVVTPAGAVLSTPGPDFLTQPSPAVLTLTPDVAESTTIVFSSVNGFSSTLSLSGAWSGVAPSGVTVSLPRLVLVPAGGSASSTLTLAAGDSPSTGTYTLIVTATNGILSHSFDIAVTIAVTPSVLAPVEAPDFSMSSVVQPSPAVIGLTPDMSGYATILLSSADGLSSTVSLSAAWSGAVPSGVTVGLPGPVSVPAGGSASSTLTLTADAAPSTGTYTLIVTATNGVVSHVTQIPVVVSGTLAVLAPVTPTAPQIFPDFSVGSTSDTVSTIPGLNAGTSVTVNSVGGFSAPVVFSVSWVGSAPTGVSVAVPQTVTPPAGGEASSPIQFTTTALVPTGTYIAQVTATSGTISHSTDITLQLNSPSPFTTTPIIGSSAN